jgi:transposase
VIQREELIVMMCVGLDVHKTWTTVVAIDTDSGEVRRFDRVPNQAEAFGECLGQLNGPLRGIMEAGRNSWAVYDVLAPFFEELLVGDASEMKRRMSERGAKTDRRDALRMALLLSEGRVPAVWIPDLQTRQLRTLTRGRARMSQLINQVACQIHSVAASSGQTCPASNLRTKKGRQWATELKLPGVSAYVLDTWMQVLQLLEASEAALETEIVRMASEREDTRRLQGMPGIGPLSALTLIAEIGDITRFRSAKALVAYAGLAPQVHQSGDKTHHGPLPKTCDRWLRRIIVLAAQHVARVRADIHLKRRHWRAVFRRGNNTAKIDTARHMLTVIYRLLRHGEDYREPVRPAA